MADRGRFWPSNVFRRQITVAGVDKRAQGYIGLLDRSWTRSLQGLSGHIPAGDSGDEVYRFNGYVDYVLLANTQMVGASRNLRGDPNTAMPATNGPLVVTVSAPTNPVANALAAVPPGVR